MGNNKTKGRTRTRSQKSGNGEATLSFDLPDLGVQPSDYERLRTSVSQLTKVRRTTEASGYMTVYIDTSGVNGKRLEQYKTEFHTKITRMARHMASSE